MSFTIAVIGKGSRKRAGRRAYGPVSARNGGYSAGFRALQDDVDPKPIGDEDPAMKAGAGFQYEIEPMPALVRGKPGQDSFSAGLA